MHWANQYIGKPWVRGARGPEAYDCLGLMTHVMREHYCRDVPDLYVGGENGPALMGMHAQWRPVDAPGDGDMVVMARTREDHVGVWLDVDRGGILSALDGPGVVFQTKRQAELSGWGSFRFYRWRGM